MKKILFALLLVVTMSFPTALLAQDEDFSDSDNTSQVTESDSQSESDEFGVEEESDDFAADEFDQDENGESDFEENGDDFAEDSDDFSEGGDDFADDDEEESSGRINGLKWIGFLEMEHGGHTGPKSVQKRETMLSNRRFRLATDWSGDNIHAYLKADFVEDGVRKKSEVDLREARLVLTPLEWMDLSLGKQVTTWGVADMLFINDLFPKNWVSNFLGRDMESMKDAAYAFRSTSYFGGWTLDLVYHPEFAPDTTPSGCRFAVYDPNSSALVSNSGSCSQSSSNSVQTGEYSHGEFAGSLKTQIAGYELAFYGYTGYFKNPKGLQWADAQGNPTGNISAMPNTGETMRVAYYPELTVYGASLEGQTGPGILAIELGQYESREDKDGDNLMIENSKLKTLIGYRADLTANLSAGVQWYQEIMSQHDSYEDSVKTYSASTYDYRKKERHNTFTLRLSFKAQQETLRMNLFHYERPEDHDRFTKFDISKKIGDDLEIVAGINLFDGKDNYLDRDFGMLKNDDNAFLRIRHHY